MLTHQLRSMLVCLIALFAGLSLVPNARAEEALPPRPYLLHINGIGGQRLFDTTLIKGLTQAGLDADCETHDWTNGDFGLTALQAYDKHRAEARKIADKLLARLARFPAAPIYITAHSGGAGVAAYALEMLPDDAKVTKVFFLAPALSPQYDLTKTLRHIDAALYVFSSPHDSIVLDTGTKLFGTIDGLRVTAAGFKGFVQPPTADAEQYRKLTHFPYDSKWLRKYGSAGSHICTMRSRFARLFLGPLLLTGKTPEDDAALATTRPVSSR